MEHRSVESSTHELSQVIEQQLAMVPQTVATQPAGSHPLWSALPTVQGEWLQVPTSQLPSDPASAGAGQQPPMHGT
jgi:hypothetical protein